MPERRASEAHDWTHGPPRQAAAVVLTLAGIFGIAANWTSQPLQSSDVHGVRNSESATTSTGHSTAHRTTLNLNIATQAELEALPGIGPSIAKRIIERRDTVGPYRSIDELDKVRGIGPVILERIRPFVSAD